MARRLALLAVVIALVAFAVTTLWRSDQTPEGRAIGLPSEELVLLYGAPEGEPVQAIVALDRVGIVPAPGANAEATAALATELGLEQSEIIEGLLGAREFRILTLPEPSDRVMLDDLARRLREREDRVEEAGLVFRIGDDDRLALLTDEIVARFVDGVSEAEIENWNAENGLEVVRRSPTTENLYVLRLAPDHPDDAFTVAARYHKSALVEFSHPNAVLELPLFGYTPNDTEFGKQWALYNPGGSGAIADADADLSEPGGGRGAWDITRGDSDVIIAIFDTAFEQTHPDLQGKWYVNAVENQGRTGVDDDHNGYVDDISGWDFQYHDNDPSPDHYRYKGDYEPRAFHGTQVAGVAGAASNNQQGVAGACPECLLLPLRWGAKAQDIADGIDYARIMGASVINISWGLNEPQTKGFFTIFGAVGRLLGGRNGLGVVLVAAMDNLHKEGCGITPGQNPSELVIVSTVISIGRSDRQDRWHQSAYGNCLDLTAPGVDLWTTDPTGKAPTAVGDYVEVTGTSYASPLTAGIAGLVLSVAPDLDRTEIQKLLQDTADKIEPKAAAYGSSHGFSLPKAGDSTHGWGRVNALEALRVAAPVADGGRGGRDVFLRDHDLDWGNTESVAGSGTVFSSKTGTHPWWTSPDIKVDAPPFGSAPTSSADFEALGEENPIAGQTNRVYVRVRNRGPYTLEEVEVALYSAWSGVGLPNLPSDFWSVFGSPSHDPANEWTLLGLQRLTRVNYSGASEAGCPNRSTPACPYDNDQAPILSFSFTPPLPDPNLFQGDAFALLAVATSNQDPADALSRTPVWTDYDTNTVVKKDNNVALRNIKVVDRGLVFERPVDFWIRNVYEYPLRVKVRAIARPEWRTSFEPNLEEPVDLGPGDRILMQLRVDPGEAPWGGDVHVVVDAEEGEETEVLGGFTYRLRGESPSEPMPDLVPSPDGEWEVRPGDSLAEVVDLWVRNYGDETAEGTDQRPGDGYRVALILSSDEQPPSHSPEPSESFADDMLLAVADETTTLAPNDTDRLEVSGSLPRDTPPGDYCVGLWVDFESTVPEADESNNFSCHWMSVREE